MRISWKVSFLAAALVGAAIGTTKSLNAAEEEQGPNQCYHKVGEPNGTCSVCANTCLGSGYLCCTIVIG